MLEFFHKFYKKHDTLEPFFGESKLQPHCKHEYLNAWSSLSYCLVGLLVLRRAKSPWLGIWGVYVFLLGIGSFLNHYYWKSLETKLFDTSSMLAVITGLCYYIINKKYVKYIRLMGTLLTLLSASSLWLSICTEELEKHYMNIFSLLITLMIMLIVYPKSWKDSNSVKGILFLVLGLFCWKIDIKYYRQLGNYNIKYGNAIIFPNFHVLWHIFSSISLWYSYKYVKNL